MKQFSWVLVVQTQAFAVFWNQRHSLGFALQSFTIGYFELLLFQKIFSFPGCDSTVSLNSCNNVPAVAAKMQEFRNIIKAH